MTGDTTATKGHRWFAAVYDRIQRSADWDLRRELVSEASGSVVEIGAGTGFNFQYYTDLAEEIIAIEPDAHMLKRAIARAERAPRPIDLRQASAEDLPFEDERFDTAVVTWVMCSVADLPGSLTDMAACTASMSWAQVTVPCPATPTVPEGETFGWRLPGPFGLRVGAGSHLTRLSGPRLRRTTPAHSL